MLDNAFLVPLIPAVSFVAILFLGKRIKGGQGAHWIGVPAVAASWVLSVVVLAQWVQRVEDGAAGGGGEDGEAVGTLVGGVRALLARFTEGGAEEGHSVVTAVINSVDWWTIDGVDFQIGTVVDGLSAILLVVVSSISLIVHVYSCEYVKGDRRYTHYFAFLSLFTASMLFFVLAENTIQMIVGWELVGVCSFVLIGHWWEDKANSSAALKAFFTNRVGDVGLLIGVIVLYWGTRAEGENTFSIDTINRMAASGELRHLTLLVAALCMTAAVMSKSGQFPLHTWLPDAMAGPTPVSALIHAATMVVAGVYLVARLYPVFYEGFSIGTSSINVLAFVGGFTALMGAALAFAQWDIKRVLAYSTISQLGYMVMALGVGAWTAAVFHLVTHAFFKAGLFLGAGSVSHAAHHTFDIREMGGLRKFMPSTYWTFVICSLALAGFFPLAGFWSKDEILVGALRGQENPYPVMLIFGLTVALLTAAYMFRVIWYTFHGEYRGHGVPHESPRVMTGPLWVLAGMAIVIGIVNLPGAVLEPFGLEGMAHRIETYAEPVVYLEQFETFSVVEPSLALAIAGMVMAVLGVVIAYLWFWRGLGPHGITARNRVARAGYTFLENRYYLDHLYTGVIVGTTKGPIARAVYWSNQYVIDAVVNACGRYSVRAANFVYRYIDQGVIDRTINASGEGAGLSGEGLRHIQTGRVQQYGALLFGAAAVFALVFVIVI
jgi:NADH-quinone oxidoreductase subunit L